MAGSKKGERDSHGAIEGMCTHTSDVSGSNTPEDSMLIALLDKSRVLGTRRARSQRCSPLAHTDSKNTCLYTYPHANA